MSKPNLKRISELITTLRDDNYDKNTFFLRHLNRDNCYCLLGLACELSGLGHWTQVIDLKEQSRLWIYDVAGDQSGYSSFRLPIEVADYYGLTEDPEMIATELMPISEYGNYSAINWSQLNDYQFLLPQSGKGNLFLQDKLSVNWSECVVRPLTFAEIADILEDYYLVRTVRREDEAQCLIN